MQIELSRDEHFLLCVLREFRFLTSLGFFIGGVGINVKEVGAIYENRSIRRTIDIGYEYGSGIRIEIWGQKRAFSAMKMGVEVCHAYKDHAMLSGLPNPDDIAEEQFEGALRRYAEFMQQHLLPIVKGDEWV